MTGFYKDYADSSDTHQNSAEASADAAEVSANEAATSASEAATSASEAATSLAAQEDLEVTSASFDTTDGTLTLTKANSGTVTTDLDGRYAELTGATFTGDVSFDDFVNINIGNDNELQLYHRSDNNASFIQNSGTGSLVIRSDTTFFKTADNQTPVLYISGNGHTGLYYNGSSKFNTISTGVNVKGDIIVNDDATVGGELTVTGSAEAELFKGDLEGAVHFKGAVASGATLTKGDVVYVSGHSGQKTEVDLADASDSSKMPAFGIVAADPNGVNVDVVTFGTLKSIDTSTYTDGDELYVDTTAGGLTATAPSGEGNLVQKIAKVVRADNSGNIKVMGAGRTNATPNLNDGNIFIGDSNNLATTASFATEVANATSGKADLSGADFTGNVTTTGTLATGGYTLASTDGTNGQALVTDGSGNVSFGNVTVDVSGKANLSGADFTGDVSVAGTFNTDGIEVTLNSVDYDILNTEFISPMFPVMRLGGTESGNKVHAVEMRPAAGGVRMHWHQTTDNIAGQTLRFHTTDRGVHVGDDRTGTYTAGDNQNNADLDFGMLVGRESSNLGSNNFGFGYDVDFATGSASNLGAGSLIDVLGTTSNSVAFGGDVKLGKDNAILDTPVTGSLVGGNIARTEGNYSFTWAKGELDSNGIYPAKNAGTGCVLFGHVTEIDADSTWSMAGGAIDGAKETAIINGHYSLAWGKNVSVLNGYGAAIFGKSNSTNRANYSLISGDYNEVFSTNCVVGGHDNEVGYQLEGDTRGNYSACFGTDHFVEGRRNFVAGHDNNSLGESGACIGQGLKTPLFLPYNAGSNTSHVWDDYSIVVGGYNDEDHKYTTNTLGSSWVTDHRFVVGTGTAENAKDNGFIVAVPDSGFSGIIMPNLASSPSYTDDVAAVTGGVPVGGLYHTNGVVKVRRS